MIQMILLTKQTEREICMQTTNVWVPREKSGWEIQTGIPDSSVGKESSCSAGDPGSIPGSGKSTGEGKGCLLLYSGLENSMDCIGHGVAKSQAQLSNFHSHSVTYLLIHFWVKESKNREAGPKLKIIMPKNQTLQRS